MTADTWSTVANGILLTIQLTVLSFAIGAVLGVPVMMLRISRIAPLRFLGRAFIEIVRGIPVIVWLFLIYNGPIQFDASLGQVFSPFRSAVLGLGLISAAFMAEIYRGSLRAIKAGQWEASQALGMSRRDTAITVIGPQMIRTSVPAAATYAVSLLKDSSIASTVGVLEITAYANRASSESTSMMPYFVAGVFYIALTIPTAWAARKVDSQLRRRVAR